MPGTIIFFGELKCHEFARGDDGASKRAGDIERLKRGQPADFDDTH